MKPHIIGLMGYKGSGKSTVAAYLQQKHQYNVHAFAEKLKLVTAHIFGWTLKSMYDPALKEEMDPRWGFSRRHALQKMGTEVVRSIHANAWVKSTMLAVDEMPRPHLHVFEDVRFENEAKAIRLRGGVIWRVDRPGRESDGHASEEGVKTIKADLIINNTETADRLGELLELAL